tara:strand:+ start:5770 stop:6240 length:471 start_codon:yes stop_codon:yes gene_type:complete
MKKSLKIFFIAYYGLILILALHSLYTRLKGGLLISEIVYMDYSLKHYIIISMAPLMFLLSIISVILVWKKKLSKILLIYPIYYIFVFIIWLNLIPISIVLIENWGIALNMMDEMSFYDVFFYFFDLGFSVFMLTNIKKLKKSYNENAKRNKSKNLP